MIYVEFHGQHFDTYLVARGQIEGGMGRPFTTIHYIDDTTTHRYPVLAARAGWRAYGHDDFVILALKEGEVVAVLWYSDVIDQAIVVDDDVAVLAGYNFEGLPQ